MKPRDGILTPIWYDQVQVPGYPEIPVGQHQVDVCVIGAGIAGLTSAYLLLQAGKSVFVLDEGAIGSGQTGRTSAHLASALDDRFTRMERLHGTHATSLVHHSHAQAINFIEQLSRDEKFDCEFSRLEGYLFAPTASDRAMLEAELASAIRCGVGDAELLDQHPLRAFTGVPCIRFGNQARFHPLKYLIALANLVTENGGKIYTGKRVMDAKGAGADKNEQCEVTVAGENTKVLCDAIVVATNTPSPINDWFGIYTKQASYRTYVVGLAVPRNAIDDALYWDMRDPYHYVRLETSTDNARDVLIVGGEDHKTGQAPHGQDPFSKLHQWAKDHFPTVGDIVAKWSGQVQEPSDGFAYIGKAVTKGSNVFVITGDSGMGLTHGTLGATIVRDLILNQPNELASVYDPHRKSTDMQFVKENLNTAKEYVDLLTPGDVKSIDQIPNGEGAIVREGLHKFAVYKNEDGQVTKCSAICTHLQCVVQWNAIEKSWDCPCHGSRFSPTGSVLMGPAVDDLPEP